MQIQNNFRSVQSFGNLITRPDVERFAAGDEDLDYVIKMGKNDLSGSEKWDVVLDFDKENKLHPVFINKEDTKNKVLLGHSLYPQVRIGKYLTLGTYVTSKGKKAEPANVMLEFSNDKEVEAAFDHLKKLNDSCEEQTPEAYSDIVRNSVAVAKDFEGIKTFGVYTFPKKK